MSKVSLPKLPIVKTGLVVKSKSEPIRLVVKSKSANQDQPPACCQLYVITQKPLDRNCDLLAQMCAAYSEVTISSYVRLTASRTIALGLFQLNNAWPALYVPLPSTSVASGCFKCHKPSTQFTADNFCPFMFTTRGFSKLLLHR